MIDDKPDAGKKKVHELQDKVRIPETVHVEGACRAHRPGEEDVEPIGGRDEEEQTEQLHHQNVRQHRRNQVGLAFEAQLGFAAAAQVPRRQDLYTVPGRVEDREAREQR